MIAALYLARKRGTISAGQFERLESLIHMYGPFPPLKLGRGEWSRPPAATRKMCGGVRRFVLPIGIGDAGIVEDVTPEELEAAVGYMLARAEE